VVNAPLTLAERRIWRSVLILADLLRFRVSSELKPVLEISRADHTVLLHLDEAPGRRMGQQQLATEMYWSRSRMSHQLTRMQARGLVERATHDGAQGVEISLTETGRRSVKRAELAHADAVRRHLFQLATEEELTALVRLADRLEADVGGGIPR